MTPQDVGSTVPVEIAGARERPVSAEHDLVCLAVDVDGRLNIINADACTGCRLCELLCPDFAIEIHPPLTPVTVADANHGGGTT